jgi:hypothetical protein
MYSLISLSLSLSVSCNYFHSSLHSVEFAYISIWEGNSFHETLRKMKTRKSETKFPNVLHVNDVASIRTLFIAVKMKTVKWKIGTNEHASLQRKFVTCVIRKYEKFTFPRRTIKAGFRFQTRFHMCFSMLSADVLYAIRFFHTCIWEILRQVYSNILFSIIK